MQHWANILYTAGDIVKDVYNTLTKITSILELKTLTISVTEDQTTKKDFLSK